MPRAFVSLEFGRGELIELEAFLLDSDQEISSIVVAGDIVDFVDLTILPPAPFEIVSVSPENAEIDVALASTIKIEFTEPLRLDDEGLPALALGMVPEPESGPLFREDLLIDEDGLVVCLDVDLAPNTDYSFLIQGAESENGLGLEESQLIVFSTSDVLADGVITGNLGLPSRLPRNAVVRAPATVLLIPFTEFDGSDPESAGFAVAATLSFDGSFAFEHVPSGRFVVAAGVDVAVPQGFRLSRSDRLDFEAFERGGAFGLEAPPGFVERPFFGASDDDDLRAGDHVDVALQIEDIRRVALRVLGFAFGGQDPREAPEGEVLFVDAPDEVFDLAIGFTEALARGRNRVELKAALDPRAPSGRIMRDFSAIENGQVIVFHDIELVPNEITVLTIGYARGESGAELAEPFHLAIAPAGVAVEDFVFGDVSGRVTLTGADLDEGVVFLWDPLGEEVEPLAGAVLEADGSFLIEEVFAGFYSAWVELSTTDGRDLLFLYDPNNTGEGDSFEVGAGLTDGIDFDLTVDDISEEVLTADLTLEGIDAADVDDELETALIEALALALGVDSSLISILSIEDGSAIITFQIADDPAIALDDVEVALSDPATLTEVEQDLQEVNAAITVNTDVDAGIADAVLAVAQTGVNSTATLSLDLDTSTGNQEAASAEVDAGATFDLAVYADSVTDLTGISIKVAFDSTQVEFLEAFEATDDEANVLQMEAGAISLFLPPRLIDNTAEFGGAILSATTNTAATGDGLVGVLRFSTFADYTGASLVLQQTLLSTFNGVVDTNKVETAALVSPPLDLLAQVEQLVAFDFDPAAGNGNVPHLGDVGINEEISVELYLNDVSDLVNYSIKLLYDPDQLSYVTFAENGFLSANGGTGIGLSPLFADNTVEIGASILGPTTGQGVTGSFHVGTMTFSTAATFTETDLLAIEASTKSFGGEQTPVELTAFARVSQDPIALAASEPTADFNGDGNVDFSDFFLFADAFGDPDADEQYNLDGVGGVDFGDFFLFADAFGQAAKAIADVSPARKPGRFLLEPSSTESGLHLALKAEGIGVRSYRAVIEYDASVYRLLSVGDETSVLGGEQGALTLSEESPGQVLVVGSRTGGLPAVEGELALLTFEPLQPEAEGLFRVRDAVVRRGDQLLVAPRELAEVEARWIPDRFALGANYPNPFNPATTIGFQLPVDAERVTLDIFDILGQRVRTLVDAPRQAGFHRMAWDSRDDAGHQIAAGVYFYRLEARAQSGERFEEVRKLLLLK